MKELKMNIITYSDLHLEHRREPLQLSWVKDADVLVLAGDIITFDDYKPLEVLLKSWKADKPVIYVSGNHEYYTKKVMREEEKKFVLWLEETFTNVSFLQNRGISIDGVGFFGGTMWTDMNKSDLSTLSYVQLAMNDYNYIRFSKDTILTPYDTVFLHNRFKMDLQQWFMLNEDRKRVVVTHHAPVKKPESKYADSALNPAFVATDILPIIENYQPNLWIYGHTHENDDQMIGNTRIISNQSGYPKRDGTNECDPERFDISGKLVSI